MLRTQLTDEVRLLVRLDCVATIGRANPVHWIFRDPGEHRQAAEDGAGATMAAEAPDLDHCAAPGLVKQIVERIRERLLIAWETEVGPVEVGMGPRRLPARIEVETEVGRALPVVAVCRIRRGPDRRAIRENDQGRGHGYDLVLHLQFGLPVDVNSQGHEVEQPALDFRVHKGAVLHPMAWSTPIGKKVDDNQFVAGLGLFQRFLIVREPFDLFGRFSWWRWSISSAKSPTLTN